MRYHRQYTGEQIELILPPMNQDGGEGTIYRVQGTDALAAKIYKYEGDQIAHKLAAMIDNRPTVPNDKDGHVTLAWPDDILLDREGKVRGFVMPLLQGVYPVLYAFNPGLRKQHFPWLDYKRLHRVARNVAAAFEAVHSCHHLVADVSESNVLFWPRTSLVSLVDTDSFQIRSKTSTAVFRNTVGRDEYTPAELIGKPFSTVTRELSADYFGLAVLMHKLLMGGWHPFDGSSDEAVAAQSLYASNISSGSSSYGTRKPPRLQVPVGVLHPLIHQLMNRCFVDGHTNPLVRPSPAEWKSALDEAEKDLRTCAANTNHLYGQHLRECPWCEIAKSGTDPFPSPPVRLPKVSQPPKPPEITLSYPAVPTRRRTWRAYLAAGVVGAVAAFYWVWRSHSG